MTLLTQGDSDGVRRCDARCHNATKPECDCVCRGRYHGKRSGSAELAEAVKETTSAWIRELQAEGIDASALQAALGGELFVHGGR